MAIELGSFLLGSVAGIILLAIVGAIILSLLMGKVREQLKHILTKTYARTSLMLIAVFDVVAAFDPTQTILGLGLSIITAIVIFLVEWAWHDKASIKFLIKDLVKGLVAGVLIAIPTPIAGIFIAWFGVAGDKRKGQKA